MLHKELKKLSRRELIEVIYQLKQSEQKLLEQVAALEEELQERRIRIDAAGSIAEAAVDITNIFGAAQITADLYLHEIAAMKEEAAKALEEAKKQALTQE